MSEVIVLRGMVDGMNLDEEVEVAGDGGLMQEIGDECAEKVCSYYHALQALADGNSMVVWNVYTLIGMALHRRCSSSLRVPFLP